LWKTCRETNIIAGRLDGADKLHPLPSATPSRQKKKRTFSDLRAHYKHLKDSLTVRKKKGDGGGELFNMKSENICIE